MGHPNTCLCCVPRNSTKTYRYGTNLTLSPLPQGLTLPPEAGYPLAPNGPSIYLMQVHYDNPDKRHFEDFSGIRVHYTHVLRSYDAGMS